MTEPDDVAEYKKQAYWNSRFAAEETYEWLVDLKDIRGLLLPYLSCPTHALRVLVIGCGNSALSDGLRHMLREGSYLCSLDYSSTVIQNMRQTYGETPGAYEWICGDMRDLSTLFAPCSFDVVLDKAGIDALVVTEGDPWAPSEEVQEDVGATLQGVSTVLKDGGVFLQVSFQQPHFRKKYLEGGQNSSLGWDVSHQDIPCTKSLPHFFYVCDKKKKKKKKKKEEEEQEEPPQEVPIKG